MVNQIKYTAYLKVFSNYYPTQNINDKNYEITLIRSLIIYFLYKENQHGNTGKVTTQEIADIFEIHRSTVVKANQKINDYINNSRFLKSSDKNRSFYKKFTVFYFKFNRIFHEK